MFADITQIYENEHRKDAQNNVVKVDMYDPFVKGCQKRKYCQVRYDNLGENYKDLQARRRRGWIRKNLQLKIKYSNEIKKKKGK